MAKVGGCEKDLERQSGVCRMEYTGRLVSVEGNLRCGPNLHQKSISRKNIKTMRTKTTFLRIVLFVFAESEFWWRLGPQRFDIRLEVFGSLFTNGDSVT